MGPTFNSRHAASPGFLRAALLRTVIPLIAILLLSQDVLASHFRGGDMWATVDANGVVTVTVRTRWRKGAEPFPFAGVDPLRFGISVFGCGTLTCIIREGPDSTAERA